MRPISASRSGSSVALPVANVPSPRIVTTLRSISSLTRTRLALMSGCRNWARRGFGAGCGVATTGGVRRRPWISPKTGSERDSSDDDSAQYVPTRSNAARPAVAASGSQLSVAARLTGWPCQCSASACE